MQQEIQSFSVDRFAVALKKYFREERHHVDHWRPPVSVWVQLT